MALDIKPTRSELIKLKGRIKQTKNGYKLLKMKRDGLLNEFRQLLAEMIQACLLYTSPSPRDLSTSRMPSSA